MTTRDNLELLVNTLKESGFNAMQLRLELEVQINSGFRSFQINDEKDFGNELMRYKLEFTKDVGGIYHFSALTATYRSPVILDYSSSKVSGLDEMMSKIDWRGHFKKPGLSSKKGQHAGLVSEVYRQLKQLGSSTEFEMVEHYYLLIYKHWPIEISKLYLSSRQSEIIDAYEKSQVFSKTNGDILDAVLTYLIVSGVYEDLVLKVRNINLESKGIDCLLPILPALKNSPCELELKYRGYYEEDRLEVSIPLKKEYGAYNFNEYHLQLSSFPKIEHGLYGRIDTELLERNLKEAHAMSLRSEPEKALFFTEHIINFYKKDLNALFDYSNGKDVAIILELKYSQFIDELKTLVHEESRLKSNELSVSSFCFPANIPLDAAVNLINGRSVFDSEATFFEGVNDRWLLLVKQGNKGQFELQSKSGASVTEVESMLAQLSLPTEVKYDVADKILMGYLVPIKLADGKTYKGLLDPFEKVLTLHNEKGVSVMNITLKKSVHSRKNSLGTEYEKPGTTTKNKSIQKNRRRI